MIGIVQPFDPYIGSTEPTSPPFFLSKRVEFPCRQIPAAHQQQQGPLELHQPLVHIRNKTAGILSLLCTTAECFAQHSDKASKRFCDVVFTPEDLLPKAPLKRPLQIVVSKV